MSPLDHGCPFLLTVSFSQDAEIVAVMERIARRVDNGSCAGLRGVVTSVGLEALRAARSR
jgi:hypothetical protein